LSDARGEESQTAMRFLDRWKKIMKV